MLLIVLFILLVLSAFEKQDGLTPEEAEQKAIAKRKMLGNIKFIGEFSCTTCMLATIYSGL